jgi:hypothetical protein
MKKIILLLFLFVSAGFLHAQTDIDKLMIEKAPNCEDIAYNCTQLIEKYYNSNKNDSLKLVLDYWEEKCGLSEPVLRIKILLSIKENNFTESLYDTTVFDYVKRYKDRIESVQPADSYNFYKVYFSYVQINGAFDKFTTRLANELLLNQNENKIEYLLCKLYAGYPNEFYKEIQNKDKYDGTRLKASYYKIVNRYANRPEIHWSLSSGIWIPFDNAKTLGVHPLLGFEGGSKYMKFIYNLSINLKFAHTANEYLIRFEDSIRKTDYFFGGYIGFEVERELLKIRKNEIGLRVGIAYDGFSTLQVNTNDKNQNNDKGKSVNSLNLNAGLAYRYNFENNEYIGIKGKYNFVHYKNTGGTNLSGNTVTIELVYGGFINYTKQYNLKAMKYTK